MKLIMIDNYDSFTFNLVQYLRELGCEVDVVRNDELTVSELVESDSDGIVISPGPCTPNEAGISVGTIRELSGKRPILGVCLGHQSIAAAFGGKIIRSPLIMHGKTSPVRHRSTDLFKGLSQPFIATRYHSLVVEPESLPDCLEVTAETQDPKALTIMGLRHRTHPTFGVQFHPESILTPEGKALLSNFIDIARDHSV